jgi:hypothetical protein
MYFWEPLLPYVFKRGWGCNGEADEEDIGLGVGKGPKAIVIFLSCGIKEAEGIWLVANPVRPYQLTFLLRLTSRVGLCLLAG